MGSVYCNLRNDFDDGYACIYSCLRVQFQMLSWCYISINVKHGLGGGNWGAILAAQRPVIARY